MTAPWRRSSPSDRAEVAGELLRALHAARPGHQVADGPRREEGCVAQRAAGEPLDICILLTFALPDHYRPVPTVRDMGQPSDREPAVRTLSGERLPREQRVHVTMSTRPDADALRRWDLLVASTPAADVAQLSTWAEVRRHVGFAPIFVFAEDAGRMVGGAAVLYRRLPLLGGVGYLPYGPVLPRDAAPAEVADVVCNALARLAGRHLAALFVQPPRGADDVSDRLRQLGFRPSTAGIAPAASLELDLSRPVSDLRKSLSSGACSGIRQASARVQVRVGTEQDLPVVAELLADTAAHHRFPPLPPAYLRALHGQLDPGNHIKIFIAEHAGVPVATQVLTCCGGVVKLRLTGMRRSTSTPPGTAALLQWETLMWAKERGYAGFDFGGISTSAVDAIRAGRSGLASRINGRDYFKASFGGRPFRFPPGIELLSSPAARVGYDLARRSELGRRAIRRARNLLRGTSRTNG
jgi:hypothetical protein